MDPEFLLFILPLLALILGVGLGWWLASRPLADLRAEREEKEAALRALDDKFRRAITDLATASERASQADHLADRVEELRNDREALQADLAALKADAANHDKQVKLLVEARDAMASQFAEVSNKLLGEAQKAFLERADARFAQSEEKNEARIKALLDPVGEKLKSYEEQVAKVEQSRSEAYGNLTGLIEAMRAGQEQVRNEAARLGNSLRNAPKARGRWGEQQLRNVLETCGLAEHTDFQMEVSIDTQDGRLRPDAIVRIPGNQLLVIDAKVSLNAYQDAFEAHDDDGRKLALAAHCASMRTHIQALGAKSYQSQFEDAPDFVVMFVPGEHFVSAALEHDPQLWDFAFERKVLLATPTNLVAIARTIAGVWRQEGLAREAREIGRLGKEMHERIATAANHLKRMGGGLTTAVNSYNQFVGSFERNIASTGRRFAELNIETGNKSIDEVPVIEVLARYDLGAVDDRALFDGTAPEEEHDETS